MNRYAELRHDTDHWSLGARVQDYQVIDRAIADERQAVPDPAADERDRPLGRLRRWVVGHVSLAKPPTSRATSVPKACGSMPSLRSSGASTGTARSPRRMPATATRSTTSNDVADRCRRFAEPRRCRWAVSMPGSCSSVRRAPRASACRRSSRGCCTCTCRIDNQDDLPVFDTAIPDLNLVQLFRTNRYVGADRVGDANQLSVGVTTRLLDVARRPAVPERNAGPGVLFRRPARAPARRNAARPVHVRRRGRGRRGRVQELERAVRLPVESRRDPDRADGGLPAVRPGAGPGRQCRVSIPTRPARAVRRLGGVADLECSGVALRAGCIRSAKKRRSTSSSASNTRPVAGRCGS